MGSSLCVGGTAGRLFEPHVCNVEGWAWSGGHARGGGGGNQVKSDDASLQAEMLLCMQCGVSEGLKKRNGPGMLTVLR